MSLKSLGDGILPPETHREKLSVSGNFFTLENEDSRRVWPISQFS